MSCPRKSRILHLSVRFIWTHLSVDVVEAKLLKPEASGLAGKRDAAEAGDDTRVGRRCVFLSLLLRDRTAGPASKPVRPEARGGCDAAAMRLRSPVEISSQFSAGWISVRSCWLTPAEDARTGLLPAVNALCLELRVACVQA